MKDLPSETPSETSRTETIQRSLPPDKLRTFRLLVIEGPDAGAHFRSSGDRTVIGTHEKADLVLTDPAVSRFHVELQVQNDRVLLRDLGSRNGTAVGALSVCECWLHDGLTLSLGRTRLRFALEEKSVEVTASASSTFGSLVGPSWAMRRAFSLLERAAATRATVLLLGETGTGKEAAAESIHLASDRRAGPFVVVDCAAIPSNLLESELFGHERGAFTGAVRAREGAFEVASGGTLFLDEIGELSLDLQPKLLRALERREFKRVGASRYLPTDARIVAATHRDLRGEVNAHRFRADLYFRLAVLEVRLPALRERPEDLAMLVERLLAHIDGGPAFLERSARQEAFLSELARHVWPGNVRELRNYLERCVAFGEPAAVEPAPEPSAATIDTRVPLKTARTRWVASFERAYLERILEEHEGNVTSAARAAGVDRVHFYRLLWRNGVR